MRAGRNSGSNSRKLSFESLETRDMLSITVTSLADNTTIDPYTTFREAINLANATPGPDEIVFHSSFAGQTVNIVLGNLTVTDRVTITGPVGGVTILDASVSADTGLTFSGFDLNPISGIPGDTKVTGIIIEGFNTGIKLQNLTSTNFALSHPFQIEGNSIYDAVTYGILLDNADVPIEFHSNLILGAGTGTGAGILITDSGQFANGGGGYINFPSHIGNFDTGTGNGITGFHDGIRVSRSWFPDLRISNNQIGDYGSPNTGDGIDIKLFHNEAPNTNGIGRMDNNIIINNGSQGIVVGVIDGIVIDDNYIGDNGSSGILLEGENDDFEILSNTFDSNLGDAISIAGSVGGARNRISGNEFYGVNVTGGAQAIDLGASGPLANDFNDFDAGHNGLQNYAEVVSAEISQGNGVWNIPVEFDAGGGSGNFILEFYRYEAATSSFRFIRSETEIIAPTTLPVDLNKTYMFLDGLELSEGDRIGVVVIDDNGSNAGDTSELSFASLSSAIPDLSPRITDVRLYGTGWTGLGDYSFADIVSTGEQFRPLPTQGIDTLEIVFSENVMNSMGSEIDGSELILERTRRLSNGVVLNEHFGRQ